MSRSKHHRPGFISVSGSLLTLSLLLTAPPAAAQFPPDSLVNLKVLPEDIEVRELIGVMRGFATGLGVRCQHCHVGQEGQPLAEFDFVSDKKVNKRRARQMLRMVQNINDQELANLEERGQPAVAVECVTCHRGQARPILIEDALVEAVEQGGAEAGVAKYRELRERYYGSHTYDFREFVLINLSEQLWGMGERDAVLPFGELNLEFFPQSSPTHTLLGQAHAAIGNREQAIVHLEKALEINPRNRAAQRALDQLKNEAH